MTQRLAWPADLQPQQDDSILVSFPDIPEAFTEAATEAEALTLADDPAHCGQVDLLARLAAGLLYPRLAQFLGLALGFRDVERAAAEILGAVQLVDVLRHQLLQAVILAFRSHHVARRSACLLQAGVRGPPGSWREPLGAAQPAAVEWAALTVDGSDHPFETPVRAARGDGFHTRRTTVSGGRSRP